MAALLLSARPAQTSAPAVVASSASDFATLGEADGAVDQDVRGSEGRSGSTWPARRSHGYTRDEGGTSRRELLRAVRREGIEFECVSRHGESRRVQAEFQT